MSQVVDPQDNPGYSAESFYAPEDPNNLLLDGDHIKAATLPKLIYRLTLSTSGPTILQDLLLTYRSFLPNGVGLLEVLQARYAHATSQDSRVVGLSIIKLWIEKYRYDFQKDCPELADKTVAWLESIMRDPQSGGSSDPEALTGTAKVAQTLCSKITSQNPVAIMGLSLLPSSVSPELSECKAVSLFKDPNCDILDCPPLEISKQLTAMEWEIWSSIKSYELADGSWRDTKNWTNVGLSQKRFEYISYWTSTRICMAKTLRDRAKTISTFVHIAQSLKYINNFNTLMAIMSGLTRAPVQRLKQAFTEVEKLKDGATKLLTELLLLTSSDKNYCNLRQAVRETVPPCIPYLGIYLDDIMAIEQEHPNYLTENNLINFEKRRLISAALLQILNFQNMGYTFEEVIEGQDKLRDTSVLDDATLMEVSMYWEPPPRGKEKIEKPTVLVRGLPPKPTLSVGDITLDVNAEWQPFLEPESHLNVMRNSTGHAMGMNKYKFIERITHHQKPDKHNTNVTLVAYPLYFTNMEFLELLMLRYRVPPPKDKTQAAIRKISAEFQTPIRLRVANTLKAWVTTYPYRFYKDALLRNTLLEFLRNDVKEGIPQLALSIEQELLNRTAAGEGGTPRAPDELVEPLLPPENLNFETAKFTDFDPVEVARQLTLLDSKLFLKVRVEELWAEKEQDQESLRLWEDSLVATQAWALEELTKAQRDNSVRAVFEGLAKTAYSCAQDCSNWQATFGIFNAFSIFPQDNEWGSLDSKIRNFYLENKDLLSLNNRTKLYTLHLSMSPPCVPYVSFYRSSVATALQESAVIESKGFLNTHKMSRLGDIALNFVALQKCAYPFTEVKVIQDFLRKPREIKTLVRTTNLSKASTVGGAKALVLDVLHSEDQVRSKIYSIVQETMSEALPGVRQEIMSFLTKGKEELCQPSDKIEYIPDLKLRQALKNAFPDALFSVWTHYDDAGLVFSEPKQIYAIIMTFSNIEHRCLLDVRDEVTTKDVVALTKVGSLYKSFHEGVNLSCLMLAHRIGETAGKLLDRCKVKVIIA